MSTFNTSDGGYISKATAKEYTENYRDENPEATNSHFFGKTKLEEVLDQQDVIGLRIYYGLKDDGNNGYIQELIIVGVNDDDKDVLDTNKILDYSRPCPPHCPPSGSETL